MQRIYQIEFAYVRPDHIPELPAVLHLPQIRSVGYPDNFVPREMLPDKCCQKEQVMTHNKVWLKVLNGPPNRGYECLLELFCHLPCHVSVSGRVIRHDIGHSGYGKRQGV